MAQRFRRYEFNGVALIVAGFVLVAFVAVGYFVGAYIDRQLGSGHLWAFVGMLIGFLAGFWDLYVVASRLLAKQPEMGQVAPPKEDNEQTDA